jgi:hypothetical protein
LDFNNTLIPLPTDIEGRMYWDEENGTISLGMHGGQVLQQIGLEQYYYIKNQSGATISNGRVVRAAGTLGASGRILGEYMIANGTIPVKYALGVATEDIINGDEGYVTEFGLVRGINATGSLYGETWTEGTILYVSPTIAGGLTSVEPQSPNLKIEMAIVINAASNGSIFVRPNRLPYLYDIQQVSYSAGTENNYDILQWSGNSWIKTNTPFFSGLTANTISATTYQNVNAVTGGTYSNGTITLSGTGNVNGTQITGLSTGGGGLTWNSSNTTQSMTADNGYVTTAATLTTFTLPSTIAFGKTVEIAGDSSGLWQLNQNSGQQIRFGNTATTVTSGVLSATSQGDCVKLICVSADTSFIVTSSIGNIFFN